VLETIPAMTICGSYGRSIGGSNLPSVVSTCAVAAVGVGVTLVIVSECVAKVVEATVGSARKKGDCVCDQNAMFQSINQPTLRTTGQLSLPHVGITKTEK